MLISESTRLNAESLIRYANLPVHRYNLMDQETNDFIGRAAKRDGCPLKEKQLVEQLAKSVHHLTRQLNLERRERLDIMKNVQMLQASAHRKDDELQMLSNIVQNLLSRDC